MVDDLYDVSGEDAVVLRLHVQPGAGRTAVVGRHGDALKVRVAAPPEGGRANQAVLELVAETLGVKATQVELAGGGASRSKRGKVSGGDPGDVHRLLSEAMLAAGASPGGNARQSRDVHRPTR